MPVPKPEILEGTWDEILHHASQFKGHRLRVTILPYQDTLVAAEMRLDALNEWLTMPRPAVVPLLNDSRAAIYAQDEDRG